MTIILQATEFIRGCIEYKYDKSGLILYQRRTERIKWSSLFILSFFLETCGLNLGGRLVSDIHGLSYWDQLGHVTTACDISETKECILSKIW